MCESPRTKIQKIIQKEENEVRASQSLSLKMQAPKPDSEIMPDNN